MSLSRREFLRSGTGAVVAGSVVPGMLAHAGQTKAVRTAGERTLVMIELSGGNDALNTLIPVKDSTYYAARPTLAIDPRRALMLDQNVGLHPAMKALHGLYQQGKLAVVQGVGYPNPSRSHFRSSEIWHRGDVTGQSTTGWLGRYCQQAMARNIAGVTPMLHFGYDTPELFKAERFASVGLHTAEELHPLLHKPEAMAVGGLLMSPAVEPANSPRVPNLASYQAVLSRPRQAKAVYPMNRMGTALSTFAQLIAQEAGPRLFYLSQSGYDTHARQAGAHASLLGALSASVGAFMHDLAAEGRDRDVLVVIFSEFGRRVKENSSEGTDHGSAGVMLLAGGSVRGGLYGKCPSLTDLHEEDLRFSVDFRDCYATVLEKWLDVSAAPIVSSRRRLDFV